MTGQILKTVNVFTAAEVQKQQLQGLLLRLRLLVRTFQNLNNHQDLLAGLRPVPQQAAAKFNTTSWNSKNIAPNNWYQPYVREIQANCSGDLRVNKSEWQEKRRGIKNFANLFCFLLFIFTYKQAKIALNKSNLQLFSCHKGKIHHGATKGRGKKSASSVCGQFTQHPVLLPVVTEKHHVILHSEWDFWNTLKHNARIFFFVVVGFSETHLSVKA